MCNLMEILMKAGELRGLDIEQADFSARTETVLTDSGDLNEIIEHLCMEGHAGMNDIPADTIHLVSVDALIRDDKIQFKVNYHVTEK